MIPTLAVEEKVGMQEALLCKVNKDEKALIPTLHTWLPGETNNFGLTTELQTGQVFIAK